MTAQEFVNFLNESEMPKLGYEKHVGRFWWPKFLHEVRATETQSRKESKLHYEAQLKARNEYAGYSRFESPNGEHELIILSPSDA